MSVDKGKLAGGPSGELLISNAALRQSDKTKKSRSDLWAAVKALNALRAAVA